MTVGLPHLEIEQKFTLPDGSIEEQLLNLGMVKGSEMTMVDWYYDVAAPHWILTPQDCWLRFRETPKERCWQLKRGRIHCSGGSTVYEETEGTEAVKIAISMLPNHSQLKLPTEEVNVNVTERLESYNIVPFARIETVRSSWRPKDDNSPHTGLCVDLDKTDFGYIVGEVEIVVNKEEDVEAARQRVGKFVASLVPDPDESTDPAIGKLEHYMQRYCKEQYDACIQGGSIKMR